MVFTRTKHGAKKLTRQLVAAGVPAVELHGNLAQNARTRNLAAFSAGTATTLVATDIAARGIHVDDVALVVHADPPIEHKAYLHRSGRTARAGAAGTVVTLMTDDQVADVRDLTRKAGIAPTTTRLSLGHPLLATLAPGERTFTYPTPAEAAAAKAAIASGAAEKQRQGRPGGGARGGSKAGHRSSAKAGAKNGTKSGAAYATNSGARSGGQRGGRSGAARAAVSPSARSGGAAAFSARGGGRRRSA
jgi:superfamily II DNA/RNA helicase